MKRKWRVGQLLKVMKVGKSDRKLFVHNAAIKTADGLVVKLVTPIRENSDGTFWFTGRMRKDYPEITHHSHKNGLLNGEDVKFDYVIEIEKLSVKEKREP